MRLTREVKRRIFEALPADYIKSAAFLPYSMVPKGEKHHERATWWAKQSPAFLLEALKPRYVLLGERRLKVIENVLGIEPQRYPDDPEKEQSYRRDIIWSRVKDSLTWEEIGRWLSIAEYRQEAYQRKLEESQEEHVPEPGEPTADELWDEGQRLAKPVLHLKALRKPKRANRRTAIWQYRDGMGGDIVPWVTVDLRYHPDPALRADGILEIVRDWPGCTAEATFLSKRLPQAKRGEKTLYALEVWEVPPPDVLMKKAKPSIRKWHEQIDGHQLLEYEHAWSAKHPYEVFHGGGVYLQLGGWPVTWPEEDAVSQLRRKLVLRTYYNSEPWIEVFKRGQRYECLERIT